MINTDIKALDEVLSRGVDELIGETELRKKLTGGTPIRLYNGIDPTSPHVHIGNMVSILKLRDFMELGHEVIFLVGSFTALIGDTSDKDGMRPQLTIDEIEENFTTYKEQASKILDFDKVKIMYNGEWLSNLKFADIVKTAQEFTLQPFIQRDLIKRRIDTNKPIGLHEVLYPIMQGYDSYHMDVDLEIGGAEQRFNMLAGRTLQKKWNKTEKAIMTTPYILGTDGRKMSKSWGNTINVDESPEDKYGKLMRVDDSVIVTYLTIGTRMPMSEINEIEKSLKAGENPIEAKKKLAFEITKLYDGEKHANTAATQFESTVQKGELPENMPEFSYKEEANAINIAKFLVDKGVIASTGEAKRIIKQGGFEIDGNKITDQNKEVTLKGEGSVVKVGKRNYVKVKPS